MPQIEASQLKLKRHVKSEGMRKADWTPYVEQWLDREKVYLDEKTAPSNQMMAGIAVFQSYPGDR